MKLKRRNKQVCSHFLVITDIGRKGYKKPQESSATWLLFVTEYEPALNNYNFSNCKISDFLYTKQTFLASYDDFFGDITTYRQTLSAFPSF
uniref:Uncharacterized protein n=1 Tax=Romanomermis culicivorax TaxID=13658 RepID=A0A915JJ63_ROMCU